MKFEDIMNALKYMYDYNKRMAAPPIKAPTGAKYFWAPPLCDEEEELDERVDDALEVMWPEEPVDVRLDELRLEEPVALATLAVPPA